MEKFTEQKLPPEPVKQYRDQTTQMESSRHDSHKDMKHGDTNRHKPSAGTVTVTGTETIHDQHLDIADLKGTGSSRDISSGT